MAPMCSYRALRTIEIMTLGFAGPSSLIAWVEWVIPDRLKIKRYRERSLAGTVGTFGVEEPARCLIRYHRLRRYDNDVKFPGCDDYLLR